MILHHQKSTELSIYDIQIHCTVILHYIECCSSNHRINEETLINGISLCYTKHNNPVQHKIRNSKSVWLIGLFSNFGIL
jgi:hypothetical protein